MGRPVKRRYDASRRRAAAEGTRERICAAAETLYAICNETTYLRLTDDGARNPKRYATWLTATLTATLLR